MLFQSCKIGCAYKTPFHKSSHICTYTTITTYVSDKSVKLYSICIWICNEFLFHNKTLLEGNSIILRPIFAKVIVRIYFIAFLNHPDKSQSTLQCTFVKGS